MEREHSAQNAFVNTDPNPGAVRQMPQAPAFFQRAQFSFAKKVILL